MFKRIHFALPAVLLIDTCFGASDKARHDRRAKHALELWDRLPKEFTNKYKTKSENGELAVHHGSSAYVIELEDNLVAKICHKRPGDLKFKEFNDEIKFLSELGEMKYFAGYVEYNSDETTNPCFILEYAGQALKHQDQLGRDVCAGPLEIVSGYLFALQALQELIGKGYWHTDVNPMNVFKYGDGYKMADLGSVKRLEKALPTPQDVYDSFVLYFFPIQNLDREDIHLKRKRRFGSLIESKTFKKLIAPGNQLALEKMLSEAAELFNEVAYSELILHGHDSIQEVVNRNLRVRGDLDEFADKESNKIKLREDKIYSFLKSTEFIPLRNKAMRDIMKKLNFKTIIEECEKQEQIMKANEMRDISSLEKLQKVAEISSQYSRLDDDVKNMITHAIQTETSPIKTILDKVEKKSLLAREGLTFNNCYRYAELVRPLRYIAKNHRMIRGVDHLERFSGKLNKFISAATKTLLYQNIDDVAAQFKNFIITFPVALPLETDIQYQIEDLFRRKIVPNEMYYAWIGKCDVSKWNAVVGQFDIRMDGLNGKPKKEKRAEKARVVTAIVQQALASAKAAGGYPYIYVWDEISRFSSNNRSILSKPLRKKWDAFIKYQKQFQRKAEASPVSGEQASAGAPSEKRRLIHRLDSN